MFNRFLKKGSRSRSRMISSYIRKAGSSNLNTPRGSTPPNFNKIQDQSKDLSFSNRRNSKMEAVLRQSKLRGMVTKTITNSNLITSSLPDKDFTKFWKWMMRNYWSLSSQEPKEAVKIIGYHHKVQMLKQMSNKRYSQVKDFHTLPMLSKYNIFFESFYVESTGQPTPQTKAKEEESANPDQRLPDGVQKVVTDTGTHSKPPGK